MSVTPPPPGGMPWDPNQGAPTQPTPVFGPPQPPPAESGWSPLPPIPPAHHHQPPPKKRKVWPVVAIIVVAVALLGGSVYFGLEYFNKEDGDPGAVKPGDSASPGESDAPAGGIEAVDFKNTAVYVKGKLVAFENGEYEDFALSGDPVFTDLDGDGDLDAAALVDINGEKPWSQVLLWIWDGTAAQPIAFEASWQWTCDPLARMTIAAGENGLALTRSTANVCGGDPATESVNIGMLASFPVEKMGEHDSATTRCRVAPAGATETTDVTGKAEPVVLNAEGAPKLAEPGAYSKVEVRHRPSPDTTIDNGYAIAVITWADGGTGCGWVPWSAVAG
ncbi:hypothetical protein [Phytomonospora endophytica]|uniref:Uncharacterized protein n=1 Tax=Phytomonospora endophytica TaxID=714109 RepID=A0A841FPQ2_9ACTN|nr:hypothetical protein [Phytomonospora endophytica]MBB6035237.1 hypothetical protein [Phytomonospora endophytica]GIG64014.1 hypothetical protein Pen01_03090 [Phytomonospora endophytica]